MIARAAKTAARIYLQDFESEVPTTVRLLQSPGAGRDHRGQLSSYARAMGGTVPAIYGPSADSVNPSA
jgi:hypothetical protein